MSAEVAKIEARQDLSAQSSTIGSTTLVTPANDGMYRLNVYLNRVSGTGSIVFHYTYTDENSNSKDKSNGADNLELAASFIFWAKSGNAVAFYTAYSGGTPIYNLHLVVESLTPA